MFTESPTVHFNQPVPVSILFSGHPGEQFRRGGEILVKPFGKVAIDAGVLFLGGNGEGEYLSFVPVTKVHGSALDFRKDEMKRRGSNRSFAKNRAHHTA